MNQWSQAAQFLCDYKVVIADTPERLRAVFKIRHQVYCQELGFEPVSSQSFGLERDEFDSKSVHCLVMHRQSQEYIACVRIVHSENSADRRQNLPFRKFISQDLLPDELIQGLNQHQPVLEVSRLAIKTEFRKHLGCLPLNSPSIQNCLKKPLHSCHLRFNNHITTGHRELLRSAATSHPNLEAKTHGTTQFYLDSQFQNTPKKALNSQNAMIQKRLVSMSLYYICAIIGNFLDNYYCYAMMEKRLVRHLRRSGIHFVDQVSPYIEHKGSRALFSFDRKSIFNDIADKENFLTKTLSEELQPSLRNRLLQLNRVNPHLELFAEAVEKIDLPLSA